MQLVAIAEEIQKAEYSYGNTQIEIDSWSSAALSLNAARNLIAEQHLEGNGKDVDPNHVTVRYGLLNDDLDELRSFLAYQKPFEATVGGIELFPASEHSDGAVPVVARIYSPELHALEEVIGEHADFKHKSFPVYKPHCTLAYCKPDAAEQYASLPVGGTFKVYSVTISHQSGVQETIPFGMTQKWDASKHPRNAEGLFTETGSVTVGDREIQVVKPKRARRDTLIAVDVEKFNARWSKDTGFYLTEGGGKNAIGNRYERFGQFLAENESIESPEVYVGPEGNVGFTNGRHRFAWLRDHGVKVIPGAVDKESLFYAKKFGYIAVQKWDESQHPRDKEGQFAFVSGEAKALHNAMLDTAKQMDGIREGSTIDRILMRGGLAVASDDLRGQVKKTVAQDLATRSGVSVSEVREIIDLWAKTSGDSDVEAVAMQKVVKTEFKLKDAAVDHLTPPTDKAGELDVLHRSVQIMRVGADVVRAEYNATQEWFKERGITHVSVYRGQAVPKSIKVNTEMEVTMQPASSWTTSKVTAIQFASDAEFNTATTRGMILTSRIPVERVLSTAVTGRGCLPEAEILILGGPLRMKVGN